MFRIKICGVTRVSDAAEVAAAGADAIGLNFYEGSPRCVSIDVARSLAKTVERGPLVVGVFVNASAERIAEVAAAVPLGAIQLHGDEPPEFVHAMPAGLPVIRAFRVGAQGLAPAAEYADQCAADRPLTAALLDAAVTPAEGNPQAYGGTGERLDWEGVGRERHRLKGSPVILAGGLNAENVARAIKLSSADGVDTASGVEASPGIKETQRVRQFVAAAKTALEGR